MRSSYPELLEVGSYTNVISWLILFSYPIGVMPALLQAPISLFPVVFAESPVKLHECEKVVDGIKICMSKNMLFKDFTTSHSFEIALL